MVKPGYRDALRETLLRHGDVIKSEHPLIDALAVELHTSDVDELSNQPWVVAVSTDAFVYTKASSNSNETKNNDSKKGESLVTALGNALSQLAGNTLRDTLGLPRIATVDRTVTGSGVALAIIDSGIAPSDDFGGRITGFYDFTSGGISVAPFDDYGHGTHVAGLIGSSGVLSDYEFQGVAPDVRLVGLKVLDENGAADERCHRRARVRDREQEPLERPDRQPVARPSDLAPARTDPLVQAVEKATAAGLIVVSSAGNFGRQPDGRAGIRGHHVAGQRTVGDYRGCGRYR